MALNNRINEYFTILTETDFTILEYIMAHKE